MEERLQKVLSRAGFGSRRTCEKLIKSGQVNVNGNVSNIGCKVNPDNDKIVVNGIEIYPENIPNTYIVLNKPKGVLSDHNTGDPRLTIFDIVPIHTHLFAVGRLDFNSQGLILLTSDGELAYRLTHPSFGHEKEYQVLIKGTPGTKQLNMLQNGVVLNDGYRTRPAKITIHRHDGKNTWLKIILQEGRKRQIREMCSSIGLEVINLIRVRIGTLELGELKPKEWRNLSTQELETLKNYVYRNRDT
jgi:23S rRNA pseudouridine2605 synthase